MLHSLGQGCTTQILWRAKTILGVSEGKTHSKGVGFYQRNKPTKKNELGAFGQDQKLPRAVCCACRSK